MVQVHPDPPELRGSSLCPDLHSRLCGARTRLDPHNSIAKVTIDLACVEDRGAIAQLGERLPCTQEVGGSIPPGSTKSLNDRCFELTNFG